MEYPAFLLNIALGAVLVENFVLVKLIGLPPIFSPKRSFSFLVYMSLSTFAAMIIASALNSLLLSFIVILNLEFLQIICYIIITYIVVLVLDTLISARFSRDDKDFHLIAANCVILGVSLICTGKQYDPLSSIFYAACAGLGFIAALFFFFCVRNRIEHSDIPPAFSGLPIYLISAALLSMAFMGFSGVMA